MVMMTTKMVTRDRALTTKLEKYGCRRGIHEREFGLSRMARHLVRLRDRDRWLENSFVEVNTLISESHTYSGVADIEICTAQLGLSRRFDENAWPGLSGFVTMFLSGGQWPRVAGTRIV